jgi:hypothetical protein
MPIWRRARGKTADLWVHKFFDIKKQMRVEFRGQFFNAFDHPVFFLVGCVHHGWPWLCRCDHLDSDTAAPDSICPEVGVLASLAEVQMNDEEDMLRCSVETF